jgi:hypothetical protein
LYKKEGNTEKKKIKEREDKERYIYRRITMILKES